MLSVSCRTSPGVVCAEPHGMRRAPWYAACSRVCLALSVLTDSTPSASITAAAMPALSALQSQHTNTGHNKCDTNKQHLCFAHAGLIRRSRQVLLLSAPRQLTLRGVPQCLEMTQRQGRMLARGVPIPQGRPRLVHPSTAAAA
jgi:hypothetical protein